MVEAAGRGGSGEGRRGRNQGPAGRGRTGGSAKGGRGAGQRSGGQRGARDSTQRGGARRGEDRRGVAGRGGFERRETPRRDDRAVERERYDGPPLPEHITGRELDRSVAAQLKSLPDKLAVRVAKHLVAAGQLIDADPKLAYQHALAARARASRLAIVREAVGEAAYAAGEYAQALAELRAAKRMNGSSAYLAVMADCERALGRPDRALTLLRSARGEYSADQQAELVIVEAGARRDRGEFEAALRCLERAHLNSRSRAPWVARLRYTYADTLVDAGRLADAVEWFHRTDAVDGAGLTDAAARATELERRLEQD